MARRYGSLCGQCHISKDRLFADDGSHGPLSAMNGLPLETYLAHAWRTTPQAAFDASMDPAQFTLQKLTIRKY
jgi:hypothetical protein